MELGLMQSYQFRRVEAGVEVLRVAMDRGQRLAATGLAAELQKDLLLLGVMLAASDSPSQSKSEKPSEPSTCEAGESEWDEEAFQSFYSTVANGYTSEGLARAAYNAGLIAESAPRKVWAVKRVSGILPGAELPLVRLFSSRGGASRYMGCNRLDPADYGITEYEVAGG